MVAINVMKATVQVCAATSGAAQFPALPRAAFASATPMTIAIEPVTIGGRTLSSAALPMRMMSKPIKISKTAVNTIPTCTIRTPSGQYGADAYAAE